jgi:hypothetical protein
MRFDSILSVKNYMGIKNHKCDEFREKHARLVQIDRPHGHEKGRHSPRLSEYGRNQFFFCAQDPKLVCRHANQHPRSLTSLIKVGPWAAKNAGGGTCARITSLITSGNRSRQQQTRALILESAL